MTLHGAFGKVLRELREKASFSQPILAKRAKLNRTFISALERGIAQPTLNTLFKLAAALGKKPEELVRLTGMIYRD